ncbi:hypothetical protein MPLB_210078 [Mesorhizobium sp. ORS 3324]|nr:hypothetical protein MPLB_210078 [Mesorhizobium sp. ORS 3324]
MPDGGKPAPCDWNRIQIVVADIEDEVARLGALVARFRNDTVAGIGGKRILLDDPAGKPIALFEPPRKWPLPPPPPGRQSRRNFPSAGTVSSITIG